MKTSRILSSSVAATALAFSTIAAAPGASSVEAVGQASVPQSVAAAPDIDGAAVAAHAQQLEDIADANGGHRAFGSEGHAASLEYIKGKLDAAGFETEIQTFTYAGQTGRNLVADWPGGDTSDVLMVGAHLDGVTEGPGINDNGSGSAGILEVALEVSRQQPTGGKQLRFAWWDAEEVGLVGSTHYVNSLSSTERSQISGYYNFDMIGSHNAGYFVYDGDDSDGVGAGPGPEGSAAMEQSLVDYFDGAGLGSEGTDFDGRSDYGPFIEAGIPSGGTFSGAEGTMTEEQAQKWDGRAGEAYDTCYHRSCDTVANLNATAMDKHSDAIAHAVWEQAGFTG